LRASTIVDKARRVVRRGERGPANRSRGDPDRPRWRSEGGDMSEFGDIGPRLDGVDAWLESTQERAARSAAAARELAALRGVGHDADDVVEATVSGSGVLIDIALDPRIRSQPVERTRQQILAAITDAQHAVTARVAEIATETWGAESPTTASLIAARGRLVAPEVDNGNT
jgi:DNA-binding protein YbaB